MLNIRFAKKKDAALILNFIQELALYEKAPNDVVATLASIEKSLFDDQEAEVVIGEDSGEPVAFAIFFHNYSTWLGRKGLYLEDLFVKPDYRGKGFGKEMLMFLIKLAKERKCGRMEWAVLDWNTPAIDFYKAMGAKPMDGWTTFRLKF